MLDKAAGACLIYAYRPVACRTYGFYVERDKGLYCHDIELRVEQGELNNVVWGNHDTVNRHLDKLGDKRNLVEWFEYL
jgi:Fe-S-cluster containining protein